MDRGGIEYFLSLVASSLTGVSVKVSLVNSLKKQRLGECFKQDGKFIIQLIEPSPYGDLLNVFLHETAHIYLHKDIFIDLKSFAFLSGSKKWRETFENATMFKEEESEDHKEREAQAETLARIWLNYGKGNSWRYSGSADVKTLKALLYGGAEE